MMRMEKLYLAPVMGASIILLEVDIVAYIHATRHVWRTQKSRHQHQADKGGLPVIESFPTVRSNSLVTSKKCITMPTHTPLQA
jgi:hypothetical protein